jgi:hypothetical protein
MAASSAAVIGRLPFLLLLVAPVLAILLTTGNATGVAGGSARPNRRRFLETQWGG